MVAQFVGLHFLGSLLLRCTFIRSSAGDGCMQEGISHEACAYAGHLGLGKLIVARHAPASAHRGIPFGLDTCGSDVLGDFDFLAWC